MTRTSFRSDYAHILKYHSFKVNFIEPGLS